ncbi:MAG: ABC transporter ATP-binding protein [Actinomycetota bacterium]
MPEPVIQADGLTKRYLDFTAVDHLDLTVGRGEVFGLLGPNGAGKTTTILMMLGLSEPSEGKIRVAGLDPARKPLEVKKVVGYVPDNVGFYSDLTGRENLVYTATLNTIAREIYDNRINDLLGQVGLASAADARAGTYSRGMRQRLGIADALVKSPAVLILDEPTIGIDPEGIREILDLISKLRDEENVTILLSSHLLSQVQAICDRVGIFSGGKLLAEGPVSRLAAEHGIAEGEVEVTAGDWDAAGKALWTIAGVKAIRREENFWVVVAEGDIRSQIASTFAERAIPLLHLRKREQSLEDIYSRYFAEPELPPESARHKTQRTA